MWLIDAYITHLTALTEDASLRSEDRELFKGYLRKWMQYRTIFGYALYVDILKQASILSLSLQGSGLDIVLGINNILKSVTALKNLAKQDPLEWPTVKLLLGRIKEADGETSYQGATLVNCTSESHEKAKREAVQDLSELNNKMRERLAWSDTN